MVSQFSLKSVIANNVELIPPRILSIRIPVDSLSQIKLDNNNVDLRVSMSKKCSISTNKGSRHSVDFFLQICYFVNTVFDGNFLKFFVQFEAVEAGGRFAL
jgi:hypothetical protein